MRNRPILPSLRLVRVLRLPRFALLLGLVLSARGLADVPAPFVPRPILFRDVDVRTMQDDVLLRHQDVLVAGGRITGLGATGTLPATPDAVEIDGRGKTLLPGLMDLHVHWNDGESAESFWMDLAAGVTTVQSMHGTPRHLELRAKIERGEVLGPRFLTTGPTTATEHVDSPERARAVVNAQADAGYDAIKMYGDGNDTMTRETYRTLIEVAHERGLRVVGHAPRNLPFDEVLASGQDSIDHMEEVYYTARPLLEVLAPVVSFQFRSGGRSELERALAQEDLDARIDAAVAEVAASIAATSLTLTPTLITFATIHAHTTDAFEDLLQPDLDDCMSPFTRRAWSPAHNRYRRAWADRTEIMDRVLGKGLEVQRKLVLACHRAGVPLTTGTDAPLTFVYPGRALHQEIELLVDCGLRPFEALRSATVVAAEVLRLADRVGTVGIGKEADLLLVHGDPCEDVSRIRDVAGVCVRGRWLDRSELDALLDELRDSYEELTEQLGAVSDRLDRGEALEALQAFAALPDPDPRLANLVEDECNSLGYAHLRSGSLEAAIRTFEAIRDTFPESWNAWDSLGEALWKYGDPDRAKECYRRSLELNPGNTGGEAALRRIDGGGPRSES